MTKRNFTASIVSRIVGMLTGFVGRGIFVRVLSGEYLGLGGFFGNVFSVISLCELGIGSAIAQSLYKPLARNDEYKVSAIIAYYSKVCRVLALVTSAVSLGVVGFLPSLVESKLSAFEVSTAFLLFALHVCVSYILAPKCTLVVCDQRMYVVSVVRSAVGVVSLVLQSAMLVIYGNYLLYLASRILVITLGDIIINMYADKSYPCLSLKMKVGREYKKSLFGNVKALVWHKAGGVLSRSCDSLLLTFFVGLSGMGKYSNYALMIGTVGAFFDVAINAVSASVGNLGAGDRGEKSEGIMRKIYFVNFWLLTVGTSIIVCILNPFIRLWLGEEMLFTNAQMLVIVSSFYFSCIRDPVQIFVNTFGLFKESKYIPMLRAVFNIVLSVIFVQKMGVAGVFLGTTLSTVLVPLCGEVRVLYKYGFSMKPRDFYKEMFCYIASSFFCALLSFGITYFVKVTVAGILLRAVCAFCITNAVLVALYGNNEYFSYLVEILRRANKKRCKSKS